MKTKRKRSHWPGKVAWEAAAHKEAVKAADKAFSTYIVARDGGKCVLCGRDGRYRVYCGHLFTRAAYSTRWDPQNAAAQCSGCNLRHEHDFKPFYDFMVARYGQFSIDDLYCRHKKAVKLTTAQIEEIARYFTMKTAALNGGKP